MKKIALLLCLVVLFTDCKKKKEDTTGTPSTPYTPPASNPPAPNFLASIPSDASGVLNASRTPATFTNNFTTQVGNASAFFYTAPGNYNYVDAGAVKCNDSTLAKLSGGSYSFSGKPVNGQPYSGIDYSAGSTWSVTGTASVPAFVFTHSVFPTDATLTSANSFTHTNAYTMTYSGAMNADSVVVFFGGDSTLIKKTLVASAGSQNYTAAQVASIKKKSSGTTAYFTFMPYKITSTTVSGKKYYFLNSTTMTYTVSIQ